MKNSEIHIGLPKESLREYFATQIQTLFTMGSQNKKKILNYFDEPFEWAIRDAEEQIKFLERYIVIMKNRQAIYQLYGNEGWKEFDVSDDVHNNTSHSIHKTFIGTDEEHKVLMKKIYDE